LDQSRLKSIEVRKELTNEWQNRGMKEGLEYAILTDEITRAWAGKSVKDYKKFKGLNKENLRDNMNHLVETLKAHPYPVKKGGIDQNIRSDTVGMKK